MRAFYSSTIRKISKSKRSQKLIRKLNPMPGYKENAIKDHGVKDDYMARPAYQRNDYLGWIAHSKKEEAKKKRLNKMLQELKVGGVYIKMEHPPSIKK